MVYGLSVILPQNQWDGFLWIGIKTVGRVFSDLASKPVVTVFTGLASKPVMGFLVDP
jgi:hypothetical protein